MTYDAPLPPVSRRQMLATSGAGFGMLGLAGVLDSQSAGAAVAKTPVAPQVALASSNPLAAKAPHHTPRAKRIIFLFMNGGPSHARTGQAGRQEGPRREVDAHAVSVLKAGPGRDPRQ